MLLYDTNKYKHKDSVSHLDTINIYRNVQIKGKCLSWFLISVLGFDHNWMYDIYNHLNTLAQQIFDLELLSLS